MGNEELNKKIARWLGWEFHVDGKHWRKSSDVIGWSVLENLPDFPNDIKACFDYIVPKLREQCWHYEMKGYLSGSDHAVILKYRLSDQYIFVEDMNPALAFCLAVEKLIDAPSR